MRSEEARRGPFPWHPRGLQITALTASSGRRALKASQPRKLPEMRKESGGLLPSWRFLPCCINGLAVREKRRPNRQGAPPQPRRPPGANQRRAFLNGTSQAYPLSRCTNLWITQFKTVRRRDFCCFAADCP